MSLLSEIRSLPAAIQALTGAGWEVARKLERLIEVHTENGPFEARLDDLERTRALWQADMEAILQKADSTLKSASNAESRSRTMLRHAEKLTDPFGPEGEELEEALPEGDAPGSEEERVQPVRLDVAPTHKELALRHKFG